MMRKIRVRRIEDGGTRIADGGTRIEVVGKKIEDRGMWIEEGRKRLTMKDYFKPYPH